MEFIPASPLSVALFVAILGAVIAMFLWAVHTAFRNPKTTALAALVLAVWLGGLCALVATDRLMSFPLRGLPFFFGTILLICLGTALTPLGGRIATAVPLALLVGFQAFRLPLELVLHAWVEQGTLPETMTWTGKNFDIISGIAAVVCAPFANRSRAAGWAANLIGLALLLNVMRVALLSAPVPFGWHVDPPLQLPFHLPYALIGPVCVGGALFGHVVLTRALLRRA
jgi:hypothetical protein